MKEERGTRRSRKDRLCRVSDLLPNPGGIGGSANPCQLDPMMIRRNRKYQHSRMLSYKAWVLRIQARR
jgi:hypothetical protein